MCGSSTNLYKATDAKNGTFPVVPKYITALEIYNPWDPQIVILEHNFSGKRCRSMLRIVFEVDIIGVIGTCPSRLGLL